MKTKLFILANLCAIFLFSQPALASDIYLEYTMTTSGSKPILSKMYGKNGDLRTETNMIIAGRQMSTTLLMLKNRPGVTLVFNSMNRTYTEAKMSNNDGENIDIKVLGNEKIGNYNCSHVRMTAEGKSWDAWYSKELPTFDFPMMGNNANTKKVLSQLKSKGISGMPVKVIVFKPGTQTPTLTMLLTKHETKTLSPALFTIPAGYKKSSIDFDANKIKNMTTQQKKEMMEKLMKEQLKH
ncbi:DUF4412 domain-containing protein [Pedobacter rhizosphaerae]|uniref:GLPGLI family protein n=1 Tax=Pedobacter rhizosphaerae TaxID=390241 RepID=A0A1H9RQ89_9SPHI|nr:DUF4412 domain-containing protein [Pedobacter rhizosphaerae]SER74847.1 GLPGLI family protein [Pedobacter rhizosphaerae]